MSIQIRCDRLECRHHRRGFAVKGEMAGKRILCPACGTSLLVPGPSATSRPPKRRVHEPAAGFSPWIYLGAAGGILTLLLGTTLWLVLRDRTSTAKEQEIVRIDPASTNHRTEPPPVPPPTDSRNPLPAPMPPPPPALPTKPPPPPKLDDFPPGQRFALPLDVLGDQRRLQAVQVTEVTGQSTFGTTVTFTCAPRPAASSRSPAAQNRWA